MPTAPVRSVAEDDPRAVAINVGANSTLPGIRGRLWPDGTFEYIPIPEREPTDTPVPRYADLPVDVPSDLEDVPVHLDPSFAEYPCCEAYTYGDEHGVKAGPLSALEAGDIVWFYASLEPVSGGPTWAPPDWGAFVIGQFSLAVDPVDPSDLSTLSPALRERCKTNAHFKRSDPDASVILLGDADGSHLLEIPLPLSTAEGGAVANEYVTELAGDSGAGPWWRRVLRFDWLATATLREAIDTAATQPPGESLASTDKT